MILASSAHPEDDLQRAVAKLLDGLGWLWFHPPNGGRRGKVQAARLKAMGVKPGVPDVLILEPWSLALAARSNARPPARLQFRHLKSPPRGVAIELKSPGGRPTPDPRIWLTALAERGWLCAVCRDLDQAIGVLSCVQPTNGRRL